MLMKVSAANDPRQVCSVEWQLIPAGEASIGNEYPGDLARQITYVEAFQIGRFAVTNRQFEQFLIDGGYSRPEFWEPDVFAWLTVNGIREPSFWRDDRFNHSAQPVTGISVFEATAFAQWASCRLPSEAEWEKAAGSPRSFPWGEDNPDSRRAKFAPDFCPTSASTALVHEHPEGDSLYGCRQMAGNLFEWCADVVPRGGGATMAPIELHPVDRHVLKGGAWTTGAGRLRISARWLVPGEVRDNVMGMRLARSVYIQKSS